MVKIIKAIAILALLQVGCYNAMLPAPQETFKHEVPPTFIPEPQITEKIQWRPADSLSMYEGFTTNKILVVFFTSPECGPCRYMASTTFQNEEVIQLLNSKFIPVMARGEEYEPLMKRLGLKTAYPTVTFISPGGTVLGSIVGYVPPEVMTLLLQKLLHE